MISRAGVFCSVEVAEDNHMLRKSMNLLADT
jgi:hypothetical protein